MCNVKQGCCLYSHALHQHMSLGPAQVDQIEGGLLLGSFDTTSSSPAIPPARPIAGTLSVVAAAAGAIDN